MVHVNLESSAQRVPICVYLNALNLIPSITFYPILIDCLICFLNKENTNIGLSNLVEHQLHLKPDTKSKHHRPYTGYQLTKKVLWKQLDNLLRIKSFTSVNQSETVSIKALLCLSNKNIRETFQFYKRWVKSSSDFIVIFGIVIL